jgi:hypothetical protein
VSRDFFDTGDSDTGGKLPLVSLTPAANFPPVLLTLVANLPPVSTRPAVSVEKFTAGVVDSSAWCTLTCKYLCEFSNKFKMTLILFSGIWG